MKNGGRAKVSNFDQGFDPRTGAPVGDPMPHTSAAELDRLVTATAAAAPALARLEGRSDRLRAVSYTHLTLPTILLV